MIVFCLYVSMHIYIFMQLYIRIFNHEEIEMARFRVIKCFGLGLNHILGVEERVVLWLCFAKCNSLTQNHSYLNLVSVRLWGGTLSVCWIELHPSLWVIFRLHLMSRDSMTGRFPWKALCFWTFRPLDFGFMKALIHVCICIYSCRLEGF